MGFRVISGQMGVAMSATDLAVCDFEKASKPCLHLPEIRDNHNPYLQGGSRNETDEHMDQQVQGTAPLLPL